MTAKSFKKVTEDFYNLLKGVHERMYKGKFIHETQNGREFIYRGFRVPSGDSVDVLALINENGEHRMRSDVIDEVIKLYDLIGYKEQ